MRSVIAIFFLLTFGFSSTEAGQLLKLPLLFEHLNTHLAEGRSDSFVDFVKEHYLDYHGDDEDKNEDSQLPFKSVNTDITSTIYSLPPTVETGKDISELKDQPFQYLPNTTLPNNFVDIFHPPRHVTA